MKNFSDSPLNSNNPTPNHIRERKNRKGSSLPALPLRFPLRCYGFCMAALFFFCFGSLFYQLNGGPPKILLDIRQYLGKSLFSLSTSPPPSSLPPPSAGPGASPSEARFRCVCASSSAAIGLRERDPNALNVNEARGAKVSSTGGELCARPSPPPPPPRPPLAASQLSSVPSLHSSHVARVNFKFLHAEADTRGMFSGSGESPQFKGRHSESRARRCASAPSSHLHTSTPPHLHTVDL